MHELSLTRSLLEIAEEHARGAGAKIIVGITLEVGALSGAVPEALAFAFEVCRQGTMAEGATLEIERVPIRCHCRVCAQEFEPADFVCECPRCGRPSTDIRRGRELQVTSLEVS